MSCDPLVLGVGIAGEGEVGPQQGGVVPRGESLQESHGLRKIKVRLLYCQQVYLHTLSFIRDTNIHYQRAATIPIGAYLLEVGFHDNNRIL